MYEERTVQKAVSKDKDVNTTVRILLALQAKLSARLVLACCDAL